MRRRSKLVLFTLSVSTIGNMARQLFSSRLRNAKNKNKNKKTLQISCLAQLFTGPISGLCSATGFLFTSVIKGRKKGQGGILAVEAGLLLSG